MFLSKRTEHSISILLFMSSSHGSEYLSAGEIANKIGVPKEFLSKILQTLTHFGIVASQRGKRGGFKLLNRPAQIKLGQLMEVFEEKSLRSYCILGLNNSCAGCECPVHEKWSILKKEISEINLEKLQPKL